MIIFACFTTEIPSLELILVHLYVIFLFQQGRRKHLKLGGAPHLEGTFFLRKRGHFLKIKRALLCLLQNLVGTCPQCPPPVPTSMCFKYCIVMSLQTSSSSIMASRISVQQSQQVCSNNNVIRWPDGSSIGPTYISEMQRESIGNLKAGILKGVSFGMFGLNCNKFPTISFLFDDLIVSFHLEISFNVRFRIS